jgi:Uncharacterised nucleotidyltransferase
MDPAETSVCAALRGAPGVWRALGDSAAADRFLAAAARHRVRPLLAWRLHATGELPGWPVAIRRAVLDAARGEAALEVARRLELCRLLEALAAAGVEVLLLKGAALAYSAYPEPWLRPREDTDLLVHAADVERARGVLDAAGYSPTPMQRGQFVSHQQVYVRADAAGRRHSCDLHWKIANPVAFADLASAADLLRDAASVALGDRIAARIPCRGDALLLACWHRVSHHRDSDDLLWLYDLHLLADGLPDADAVRIAGIARATATAAICARGLALASDRFGTRVDPALFADAGAAHDGRSSVTRVYLDRDARKVDLLAADLRALPDWRSRLRLLREHLFPPAAYMLAGSGHSTRAALPALYVLRIARGARAWFRRPTS